MRRIVPRLLFICVLAALVLLGVGTKLYRGRFETWFHNYAGGIVYEVFWVVLFGALFTRAKPWRISLSVLLVTCALEVLQLWHPPVLEAIRANFLGRALIGDGFDAWDFPYYVVGSGIGWLLCRVASPWRSAVRLRTNEPDSERS
jgi:hypothetical protein